MYDASEHILNTATATAILGAITALLRSATTIRVRIPKKPRRFQGWLLGSLSTLGLAIAIASPAGARGKKDGSPLRPSTLAPEPWTRSGGTPPPSHPPVGSRAIHPAPWVTDDRTATPRQKINDQQAEKKHAHPAIHGRTSSNAPVVPLFPRAGRMKAQETDRTERAACMARHPAGKGTNSTRCRYTVKDGDTLWSIAAATLATDEMARIARYWPLIHRANRNVIGSDPNLIFTGQVLDLPHEARR